MARNKNRPRSERVRRSLKLVYLRLIRLNDPPERIARGAAIGVLMGILPTFGIGGLLSVALAFVLRANKAAAVIGSMIMNPFTSPFFWMLSAIIGSYMLGEDPNAVMAELRGVDAENILRSLGHLTFVYMAGNVALSTAFTFIAYYLVKAWIIEHRRHKTEKREKDVGR